MTDVAINIDMNKPCTQCGQMGSTDSGLCLDCAGSNIVNREDLMKHAVARGNKQCHDLLASHIQEVHRAYLSSDDGKLSIGLTIDIAPSNILQDALVVRSKINFVESRVRDEKTSQVDLQCKLPM